MRRLWLTLKIIGLVIVVLVVAGVAVLYSVDVNRFKPRIAELVQQSTGRQITMDGPLDLRIGLSPSVVASDVTLANAEWGTAPAMAKIGRLEVEVALWPLIRGGFEIENALIADATILLETNAEGVPNWKFTPLPKPPEEARPPEPAQETAEVTEEEAERKALQLNALSIRNLRLTYVDGRKGSKDTLYLEKFALARGDEGLMGTSVAGAARGVTFAFDGSLPDLNTLMEFNATQTLPLALEGRLGSVQFAVDGRVVNPVDPEKITATVSVGGPELAEIGALAAKAGFEVVVPPAGPFKIGATINATPTQIALTGISLDVGRPELLAVQATGAVANAADLEGLDLTVALKGDLGPAAKLVNRLSGREALPDFGTFPIAFNGKIAGSRDALAVSGMDLSVGTPDRIQVRASGAVANVMRGQGMDLAVAMDGNLTAIEKIAQTLGLELRIPDLGPFPIKVTGAVKGDIDEPSLTDLDMRAGRDGFMQLSAAGNVEDVTKGAGLDLRISAVGKGEEIIKAVEGLGVGGVPDIGSFPLNLQAVLRGGPAALALSELQLEAGRAEVLRVAVSGGAEDLIQPKGLDLTLDIDGSGQEILRLARAFGVTTNLPDPGAFPVDANLRLRGAPGSLTVSDLELHAGRPELVRIDASGSAAGLPANPDLNLALKLNGNAPALEPYLRAFGVAQDVTPIGPFTFNGKVRGKLPDVAISDLDANLGQPGKLQVALKGTTRAEGERQVLNVAVDARGQLAELRQVLNVMGVEVDIPALGPFQVTGTLAGTPQRLSLSNINAEIGQPQTVQVSATGSIANLSPPSGINLEIKAQAAQPSALASLIGEQAGRIPPFMLDVGMKAADDPQVARLDIRNAKVGDSDLAGQLTVNLAASPPRLSGSLKSNLLDLAQLSGKAPAGGQAPAGQTGAGPGAAPAPQAAAERPAATPAARGTGLPNDPITIPGTDVVAFNGDIAVTTLVMPDGERHKNIGGHVVLARDQIRLSKLQLGLAGGRVSGDALVRLSNSQVAGVDANLRLAQVGFGKLMDDLDAPNLASGGALSGTVRLAGTGASVAKIMGGANGQILLELKDARLQSSTLNTLGADALLSILSAINPFSKSESSMQIQCGVLKLGIRNGVASGEPFLGMQTDRVNVVGSGTINFQNGSLDLSLRPEPRADISISVGSLASLVKVGGTLANPQPSIDFGGIARTGLSIGAAIATGGLSLLGEKVLDTATKDRDPCGSARAG